MPTVYDAFPSKNLSAADLDGDTVVTIDNYEFQEFKGPNGKETKPVLTFLELDKALVCNKTNAMTISKICGADLDDWLGKQITLYPTETSYNSEMVACIRVRSRPPVRAKGATKPAPAKAAAAPPPPADGGEDDSDIPF